jgi:hypothetical protein
MNVVESMTLQRDGLMETGSDILSEDTSQAVRAALMRQRGLTRTAAPPASLARPHG